MALEPSRTAAGSPRRARLLAAAFVALLALQLGVPLTRLAAPRPARFGWQMYTGFRPRPRVFAIAHDGRREPVELPPLFVRLRGEIDVAAVVPPHLCRTRPSLRAVRLEHPSGEVAELPCG